MESRLIRKEFSVYNSIFILEASFVYDVFDIDGNLLKYIFNPKVSQLEVFGVYNEIDVFYTNIEKN